MKSKPKIELSSNRSFGLVFFTVFFVISLWSFRGDPQQIKIIPFIISLFFLLLGLINSKILSPLNKLWFKFGIFLGSIISPFIMGIIFFGVVTPIALFMRLIGKDLLNNKSKKDKKTYWIVKEKSNSTMKQQF